MSANADVLRSSELIGSRGPVPATPQVAASGEVDDWNPEDFAREQIRGLVQRVFFASGLQQVRQVVFSAAGPDTYVADICDRVGQALALETHAHIAVVGRDHAGSLQPHSGYAGSAAIKSWSTQIGTNLWRVPGFGPRSCHSELGSGPFWLSGLAELRTEFEYAVIHGPVAGTSSETALLGQLTDELFSCWGLRARGKRRPGRSRRRCKARSLEFWELC